MRARTPAVILATTVCLGACTAQDDAPVTGAQAPTPGICDVVLSADAASQRPVIERLQAVARARGATVAHLERLGWSFVAAARESADAGFYTLALGTADCIDAGSPDSLEALLLRAHTLLQQHRFRDAEGAARSLIARRGWWMDQAVLGDALLEQGKLTEAVAAYQAMADERPGPEAYARIAQIRWLTGDLDGALDFMARAARATDGQEPAGTAWYRARLAVLALQAGDGEAALELARSAATLVPDFPPALAAEGRALLALGRHAEAARVLRRAAERSGIAEHQWLWVEAEQAAGNSAGARLAEASLARTGSATDPRTYSMYLATRGGDAATALTLAREELAIRKDVQTHDALAWALYANGSDAEALEQAQLAVALGTTEPRLWLHAGLIALRAGDRGAATPWLARAAAHRSYLLPSEQAQLRAAEANPEST